MIPLLTRWLHEIRSLHSSLLRQDKRLMELLAEHGDQGGHRVEEWVRNVDRLRSILRELETREIRVEDLEKGLFGLPSIRCGREVLLSWREGDERIEFWSELDGGKDLRTPLA